MQLTIDNQHRREWGLVFCSEGLTLRGFEPQHLGVDQVVNLHAGDHILGVITQGAILLG